MAIETPLLWRESLLPLAAGTGLGLAYFGGLWWTTRQVGRVAWPGAFFFASFVLRLSLLLAGIWLVTGGRLPATAFCVGGVLIGRRIMVERVRGEAKRQGPQTPAPGRVDPDAGLGPTR